MKLSFIAVETPQQFRDLLAVRNECRDTMTHTIGEINMGQQKEFMDSCWSQEKRIENHGQAPPVIARNRTWYEPYLLYDSEWPIGFGLLKWDGDKYWMTIGLIKAYRGKGLSRILVDFITGMGYREKKEVWLDVWDDNENAISSYIKTGYEFKDSEIRDGKELHLMKYNPDQDFHPREEMWLANHGKSDIINKR